MSEKLWETCREAKDTMQPHKTNQDIADESGVSVNAVSQFLRGETTMIPSARFAHPSAYQWMSISALSMMSLPSLPMRKNSAPRMRPFARSLPSSRNPCACTGL